MTKLNAIIECPITDLPHTDRDFDLFDRCASNKPVDHWQTHASTEIDGKKETAIFERPFIDNFNGCRDDQGPDGTIVETIQCSEHPGNAERERLHKRMAKSTARHRFDRISKVFWTRILSGISSDESGMEIATALSWAKTQRYLI
jgi:hypothetical protein